MDKAIVATTQQQMRVFESQEDYQHDVYRYMRMAQAKGAKLIIFPALSPAMLVPPLVSSPRLGLMKRAERGRGPLASLKDRLMGRAADAANQALGGGLRSETNRLLNKAPEALYEAYVDLFSAAALKFRMTVVAGSFYLRLSEEASSKHVSFVFGPDGQIIGQQEKVHLTVEEMSCCQAGEGFRAIETEIGQIGILIGEDAFFPESGRLLAYQRSDVLINLTACDGPGAFLPLRHAFLARLNENELVGAQSCLVGPNRLTASGQDFVGKSGLFTPMPLSPRQDGILFETGAMTVEGIIAETLNLAAMRQAWTQETPRLRQGMRVLAYQPLGDAYRDLRTLDQAYYAPDDHDEMEDLSELPPPTYPSQAEPETPDEPSEADEAWSRRDLDLSGRSQKGSFDLLASPFSEDEASADEASADEASADEASLDEALPPEAEEDED